MITTHQLATGLSIPMLRAGLWVDHINLAMIKYEINTSLRIAHFVAQIAHESGNFIFMHELSNGDEYNNRADLGNTKHEAIAVAKLHGKSVGFWFKGHGLIQITGYDNHKACGAALGLDLIDNPDQLEIPKYAALSAGWFWATHHLNIIADSDLLVQITKAINGGTTGLEDRRLKLESIKKALGI